MLTDIEIAKSSKMMPISQIAKKINIDEEYLEYYGKYKAKINLDLLKQNESKKDGKLILVTAISPTPLGEGKSTTTIGLVDALNKINVKAIGALREPSLGPVFGVKGGAAGGGYAQVNPMDELNLHFTGDIHAITAANNLISACIDNHLFQGNELKLNPKKITWQRCMDLNDRALREVKIIIDKDKNERTERFNISVASEIMAIFCLAKDINDLRERIDNLIIGYNYEDEIVTVKDLKITGSILALLKDAIKPNIIQTLENNPIIVHGGPFANIAHGCNSIIATKTALKLADVVVTEAGFGADLGAEKFLDIKCREANLKVSAVVIVATIKALKYHGGVPAKEVGIENTEALIKGIANLEKHIESIKSFGLPYVVAINRYANDTDKELRILKEWMENNHHPFALSEVFAKGSNGGIELANKVMETLNDPITPKYIYTLEDTIETKIKKIAKTIYGASDVIFTEDVKQKINELQKAPYNKYYICMAKTPLSLTDNPKAVGCPKDFLITIREIRISAGAKFLVCLTSDIMTMPGLPKEPLAKIIDLNDNGEIINLS